MDDFFSEYGWAVLEIIVGFFAIMLMLSLFSNTSLHNSKPFQVLERSSEGARVNYVVPKLEATDFIVENAILDKGATFNWKDYVSVKTNTGLDLIDYVHVVGTPDTTQFGSFTMTYTIEFNGKTLVKEAIYYVRE